MPISLVPGQKRINDFLQQSNISRKRRKNYKNRTQLHNYFPPPKESFVISKQKAKRILEILEPNIFKKRVIEEKTPVKLDQFYS